MRLAIILGFVTPFLSFMLPGCRKDQGTDLTSATVGYYMSSTNSDNVTFIKADNSTLSVFCFAPTAGTSYTWDNVKMTSPTQFTINEMIDSVRYTGSGTILNGVVNFTVNDTVSGAPAAYSFAGVRK